MVKHSLHTIERFALDVNYYEVESAKRAQSSISALASNQLSAAFEKVCDKYGEEVIFKLRRIQMDLGDIPEDILESELILRFENKLSKTLEALKRGEYMLSGVEGFELKQIDESLIEGLIHFLNYGTLPYYVEQNFGNESIKELFTKIEKSKIPVFRKELRNSITSLMAQRRIAHLFPGDELLQFFLFMLPKDQAEALGSIFNDFVTLVELAPDTFIKRDLMIVCREFFVREVLNSSQNFMSISSSQLLGDLMAYLENDKNILPEKWIPEIMIQKNAQGNLNGSLDKLITKTSDYYVKYLKGSKSSKYLRFGNDIFQKQNQVMEMKELAEKETVQVKSQLNKFVKDLVEQVKHFYKTVEEERIETVILGIADEILPSKNINAQNFEYWAEAISSEVKRLFGVSLETQYYKSSNETKFTDAVGNLTRKSSDVNSSVALAYWAMFLAAGITPFKRLYVEPKSKLVTIFSDLINNEPESAAWQLKQQVNDQNVMIIAWWFKESLGEELFRFYKSNVSYNLSSRLENDFSYASVLVSVFFATGNFPWPELNNHGQAELIQFVNEFISDSDNYLLEQIALEYNLFDNVEKLEKVLSMIVIEAAKKLIQIRKNLIEKGLIDSTVFNKHESLGHAVIDKKHKLNNLSKPDIAENDTSLELEDSKSQNLNGKETKQDKFEHTKKDADGDVNVSFTHDEAENGEEIKDNIKSELSQDVPNAEVLIKQEYERWMNLSTSKILDEIAYDILHFMGASFYDVLPIQNRADLIFRKISVSAGMSYYQTAALLVDLPRREMTKLLEWFDIEQRDYIKKLVKSYRSRFVSMAEDIRRSEEEALEEAPLNLNEDQTLFVKNAGMVLLNPYLVRLFKRFDLVEGKNFKDTAAKEKGVYLLQYLTSKSTEPEEFELSLNKILCGIPLGLPLKTEVNLSEEEKEICDELLDAMIKNWGVLKNTSADGLRTSFLMRDGVLRKEATGWKLQIEKKVYDILLEKLPWGYSMIQLPWMELPLYTEWETK